MSVLSDQLTPCSRYSVHNYCSDEPPRVGNNYIVSRTSRIPRYGAAVDFGLYVQLVSLEEALSQLGIVQYVQLTFQSGFVEGRSNSPPGSVSIVFI